MPQAFHIEATTSEHAATLRVTGELDVATVDRFRQAVEAALRERSHVEIDLRDLDFLDSSGLKALVAVHNAAAAGDHTYQVLANPRIVRTFLITGLDKTLAYA